MIILTLKLNKFKFHPKHKYKIYHLYTVINVKNRRKISKKMASYGKIKAIGRGVKKITNPIQVFTICQLIYYFK